jgi:hypothetical protein
VLRTPRLFLSITTSALLALGVLAALPAAPAHAADTDIEINEIESNGGFPDDWVELINTGGTPVDVSGWVVRDVGITNDAIIPGGTTIPAGGLYTVDMGGLSANGDTARVFAADGTTLIDSHIYPAGSPSGTWSACPEPGDVFVDRPGSKGLPNDCTSVKTPWPGGAAVTDVDNSDEIGDDFSGIVYEGSGAAAPGSLWGVSNGDGTLRKFTKSGATWAPAAPWTVRYSNGLGQPDTEGITMTDAGSAGGLYIATERDGLNSGVSRPAVLRVVPTGVGGSLNATNTWDLADLTGLGANASLEGVGWVPDSYLTSKGFKKTGGTPYNPADYPNHGSGLFFVGVEQTGEVIGYALNHSTNASTRVVTIPRMMNTVTDLVYDSETQALWASCDDNCNGRVSKLGVDPTTGDFVLQDMYERPTGGDNHNNEGFAIASRTECVGGTKPVFWADDGNDNSHALRAGTLNCTPGTGPTISGAATSSKAKTASGWYGAPVTVTFTCTPGSSPIAGGCPAPAVLSTSGANQSVSRTIHNGDFAAATATVSDIDIDLVKPTAKITGVKKGKTYAGKKKPKCKASDALSGLDSCKVKQKKKGSKYIVTATATDKAGNVTTVKLTYKVKKKK